MPRLTTVLPTTIPKAKLPRIRLVHFNDVYELKHLPRVQTFVAQHRPDAVVLSGDFLSPSALSAVDGGKGMIETLRAVGLTHCSLGNHEADLSLSKLQRRLRKLSGGGAHPTAVTIVNSNVGRQQQQPQQPQQHAAASWLQNSPWMPPYAIVQSNNNNNNNASLALCGLLSDEPNMFRDGTFRGAPIASVTETYRQWHDELSDRYFVLPLTHQSIERDQELGQHMLDVHRQRSIRRGESDCGSHKGLILGGHEHLPSDVTVRPDHDETSEVRILKSGTEAEAVNLIDLTFDPDDPTRLVEIENDLVEMKEYPPSVVVSGIVAQHMSVLNSLENEDVVQCDTLLPPGALLSSRGSRYRQTSVGSILCEAVKEELEVDVCVINGATIKGETEYSGTSMSYANLKKELPFPTKMVVIPMKRWQLHESIQYSRTQRPPVTDEEKDAPVERKGYMQVDATFDRLGFHTGDQDDDLTVAIPRNLLNGFCEIKPLIDIGKRLKEEGRFPADDDFIRAIDLVVRYFCKERWFEMTSETHFHDLDKDKKGYLSKKDVKRLLHKAVGHEPADFVVDNMMAAIDADGNGTIDAGEYSYLLAQMERDHGPMRFD